MSRTLFLSLGLVATTLIGQTPTGVDAANIDRSVKPCEDFYQFANGGWLKNHPLPEDKSRYGAFEEVRDRNRAILKEILEETSVSPCNRTPRRAPATWAPFAREGRACPTGITT